MRLSEVFLRLASALVAWMVIYAYVIWLAALHAIGCGPDGDEIFRLLLGMAPLALGGGMMLPRHTIVSGNTLHPALARAPAYGLFAICPSKCLDDSANSQY